jgi:hypothetical protein
VGLFTGAKGATFVGVLGFALATPIVHMAHGNIAPGFGSIGLRLLLPPVAAGFGALAGLISGADDAIEGKEDLTTSVERGAAIGAIVGAVGCAIIDTAALAYTKEKVESASLGPPKPSSASGLRVTPTFALGGGRASVGLGGTF